MDGWEGESGTEEEEEKWGGRCWEEEGIIQGERGRRQEKGRGWRRWAKEGGEDRREGEDGRRRGREKAGQGQGGSGRRENLVREGLEEGGVGGGRGWRR